MIISLGTGVQPPRRLAGNLAELAEKLKQIVTDTEVRNTMFQRQHRDWIEDGRLYRYNVQIGLGEVSLEEHEAVPAIEEFTSAYLEMPDTQMSLKRCALAMKEGGQRLHYIGGDGR